MLNATVSGSFHRHMAPIYDAVGSLREAGVNVLSPSDPRVVDHIGDFLFVASDKLRSIKLVQDRHLAAIRASNFLWVVCPDGYTGSSTSMEIGAAYMAGVPVFSDSTALDSTMGAYVTQVSSICDVAGILAGRNEVDDTVTHVLIEPIVSIEQFHSALDTLSSHLLGKAGDRGYASERAMSHVVTQFRKSFAGCGE